MEARLTVNPGFRCRSIRATPASGRARWPMQTTYLLLLGDEREASFIPTHEIKWATKPLNDETRAGNKLMNLLTGIPRMSNVNDN